MSRTNAQVALEGATIFYSGRENISSAWLLALAQDLLNWLDEQDRTAEKLDPVSVFES